MQEKVVVFITANAGANFTDNPVNKKTIVPVTRCSLKRFISILLCTFDYVVQYWLPNAQELRRFSGSARFGLHFEGIDVPETQDSGSDAPRQSDNRADAHHNADY